MIPQWRLCEACGVQWKTDSPLCWVCDRPAEHADYPAIPNQSGPKPERVNEPLIL